MPITVGFLAGIAGHIVVSQLPGVLGLPAGDGAILDRLAVIAGQLSRANPVTLAIGLGVLAIMVVLERTDVRIPGALIGVGVATAAVVLFGSKAEVWRPSAPCPAGCRRWPSPTYRSTAWLASCR